MDSEFNIVKLYELLVELGISVIDENGDAKSEYQLICDMFRAWQLSHNIARSRKIQDALDWMARKGAHFTEVQLLLLNMTREEQEDMEVVLPDSNPELDAFLNSFTVVGGDNA